MDAEERWEFVWPIFCGGFVGRICGKAKRDVSPEAEAVCGADGQPCAKVHRAAEAFAAALAIPAADAWYSFCSDRRSCPKNREAVPKSEAQCLAADGLCATVKRFADALFVVAAGAQMNL